MSAVSAPEFATLARKVAKNWMGWKNAPAPAANARKAAEAWQARVTDSRNTFTSAECRIETAL